jgi:hypothetical protein
MTVWVGCVRRGALRQGDNDGILRGVRIDRCEDVQLRIGAVHGMQLGNTACSHARGGDEISNLAGVFAPLLSRPDPRFRHARRTSMTCVERLFICRVVSQVPGAVLLRLPPDPITTAGDGNPPSGGAACVADYSTANLCGNKCLR